MSQTETQPITDREQIIEQLKQAEKGDELTVEAIGEIDGEEMRYKDNREVYLSEGLWLTFGDPVNPIWRMINTERGTVHRCNEDGPIDGLEITKLWVWGSE